MSCHTSCKLNTGPQCDTVPKKKIKKKKNILKQCQEKHHYSLQFYFSHFIFLPLKNLFFTHLFSNSFHTAKNHPSFLRTWHRVWIKISNFHQLIPGWILHQFFLSFRLSQCFWSILFMVLLSMLLSINNTMFYFSFIHLQL